MKKILLVIFCFFAFKIGYSQVTPIGSAYPIPQNVGNTTSTQVTTNSLRLVQGLVLPSFTDTTSANLLPYLKNYPQTLITTTSGGLKIWIRNLTASGWVEVTGGGGSTTIYTGDGTIQANRTVQLDDKQLNFDRGGGKQVELHPDYSKIFSPDNTKIFSLYNDSVTLVGIGQSASVDDSVVVRTSSGRLLTRAQSAIVGVTPTWQQTLATIGGDQITTPHIIDVNGNTFILDSVGSNTQIRSVATNGTIRIANSNGTDSSVILVNRGLGSSTVSGTVVRGSSIGQYRVTGNQFGASFGNTTSGGSIEITSGYIHLGQGYVGNPNMSEIRLHNDSIIMLPPNGLLNIDTLNYTLSTTGKKLMIRDTATGRVWNIDPSLITGTTPTLQQVLTAGSELTTSHTILGDGGSGQNNLIVERFNQIIIGTNATNFNAREVQIFSGEDGDIQSNIIVQDSLIEIKPSYGDIRVDSLLNRTGQNSIIGWDSTGSDRGQVGYITIGSGLSLSSGTLSATGGGVAWNDIANPTGDLALTFGAGESTTFTDQNTTEDLFTVNNATSTTNSLFSLNRTSTALAAGNNILELISSGANGTSSITATGLNVSVTNTGTTSTNYGLNIGVSGASTNYAIFKNAGTYNNFNGVWISGSAPGYFQSSNATGQTVVGHSIGNGANSNYTLSKIVWQTSGNDRANITSTGSNFGTATAATSTLQTAGSFGGTYTATATGITLDATHFVVNVTATGQTITLPTAVGITGRIYTIKLTASGTGTVGTTSSQNIDASTTYSLSAQYKFVTVQSDGANWIIIGQN